jgi:carbamoyltransferase
MTSDASSQRFPLRLGEAKDFKRVASLLNGSGFDEPSVCRALKIENLSRVGQARSENADFGAAGSETLEVLVRLFLLLEAVGRDRVERTIDRAALNSLLALDLLRLCDPVPDAYCASVFLCPVEGLLIASDRHLNPDGSQPLPLPDAVFPAVFAGTLLFLRVISKKRVRDGLDLCSGSGVGALVMSKFADRSAACDITGRSVHFARFNALLNGCTNVEAIESDLYFAVEGRTFDLIVAHPPYVPSLPDDQVFRDGGQTGEELLRRIVEGLPGYLRPGGRFYCVSAGWETAEGPLEHRVRKWLGPAESQFDVVFAYGRQITSERLARELAERSGSDDPGALLKWDQLFGSAGMQRLVYGALVISRRSEAECAKGVKAPPLTLRTTLAEKSDGACFDWALDWYRWRAEREASAELEQAISNARPRFARDFRVDVAYMVREGTLVASDVVLKSDRPFEAATRVDLWVMPVVANFNGERTVAEVYQTARECSELPESLSFGDFTALVANMIGRGYLETDERPLP